MIFCGLCTYIIVNIFEYTLLKSKSVLNSCVRGPTIFSVNVKPKLADIGLALPHLNTSLHYIGLKTKRKFGLREFLGGSGPFTSNYGSLKTIQV